MENVFKHILSVVYLLERKKEKLGTTFLNLSFRALLASLICCWRYQMDVCSAGKLAVQSPPKYRTFLFLFILLLSVSVDYPINITNTESQPTFLIL